MTAPTELPVYHCTRPNVRSTNGSTPQPMLYQRSASLETRVETCSTDRGLKTLIRACIRLSRCPTTNIINCKFDLRRLTLSTTLISVCLQQRFRRRRRSAESQASKATRANCNWPRSTCFKWWICLVDGPCSGSCRGSYRSSTRSHHQRWMHRGSVDGGCFVWTGVAGTKPKRIESAKTIKRGSLLMSGCELEQGDLYCATISANDAWILLK